MADPIRPLVPASQLEPIAVIGLGCRFAGGVDSPERFWHLLMDGRDAVGEVLAQRWAPYAVATAENAALLRRATRWGAFLEDIEGFDADFFGITPREAALMDPQQRILLEVTWEALEHARITPRDLAGTDTGVFMGVGSDDYGRRLLEDLPRIEAWTGIGGAFCAVANRISYTLDLRGPSVAVDTACSASLVALHMACQSLRAGESPVAIAGGVLVMAGPGLTLVLDAAGATAPDGRCKSFDASADGYGRGEGAGVVVLKTLSAAQRDGDRILALIRGSAVNQDGKTNGIMAPSREAQEHLLRVAYQRAGIPPETVDYVEAHGTGTRMGDPIEAGAMAAVFGAARAGGPPCLIGSVKPNIGHLEAAAGVAGVIKTVLALNHGAIPPTANFTEPNPGIDWARSGLSVVSSVTPWPVNGQPRRAGVSGFGYGGTIAHIILEEAPPSAAGPVQPADDGGVHVYPLDGTSEARVRDYAGRLADWLTGEGSGVPLASVGRSLHRQRSRQPSRAAVVASDRAELFGRLRSLAAQESVPGLVTGSVLPGADTGLVWVFSGHGSQWTGMGQELLATEPAFAAVFDELDPIFQAEMGFSPRDAILGGDLGGVDRIQPLIFAMQVGLAAVWRSRGVRPAAVIGHSVGEIAAAVTAGVFDLADGARLICRRSALLRRAAGKGGMAMVNLGFEETARRLADVPDVAAAIAASPISTVISGGTAAVAAISERWAADGLAVRKVDSDVAFHTDHMEPLLADLVAAVADLHPATPHTPVYSTALTDPRDPVVRDGTYWAANLRNPVRLAAAVAAAAADGYRLFLEVSPHPVLVHSVGETLGELDIEDGYVAHSLRRAKPERETLVTNLGALYCAGVPVDWSALRPAGGQLVDLPVMGWQHRPYWAASRPLGGMAASQHDVDSHTLLGTRIAVNGTTPVQLWQTYLDHSCRPYPGDHPVHDIEIIPAAVLLNTFFAAATTGSVRPALGDVALRTPVTVSSPRELQVVLQDGALRLASRLMDGQDLDEAERSWMTHTTATIAPTATLGARSLPIAALRQRCDERLDPGFVVDRLAGIGVAAMGFPWVIEELYRGEGELFAVVSTTEPGTDPTSWGSALDAALSTASVVFSGPPQLRMPAAIREVVLDGGAPARVLIAARVVDGPGAVDTVDVRLADEHGRVVARLTGLRYGVLDGDPGATASPRRLVHELTWRPLELTGGTAPDQVVFVGDGVELISTVQQHLLTKGISSVAVRTPEELAELGELPGRTEVLVVPAATGEDESVTDATVRTTWLLTRTAQLLAGRSDLRAWCLTQGVRESTAERTLAHAPLWGLGRVIAGEHPEIWGAVLNLDPQHPAASAAALVATISSAPGEDVVVLRDGVPHAGRLTSVEREPVRAELSCRADGTYLITGGLGVLGLEVARWLVGRGARRLVLAGRRGLVAREEWDAVTDPDTRRQIEAVRALEALGVTVRTLALDIADEEQAAKLLSSTELGLPPIRGVVHAAGVLDNRMVRDVDEESLRRVLVPKAEGARVLHELFPPGTLDFLVLFSSCGQLLELTGQASYASGNAFLDALAAHRGGDTVSFGWTSWRGLGMSTSSAVIDIELAARGTADISVVEALRCWEFASRYDTGYFAVLRTIPLEPGASRLPLLSELAVPDVEDTGTDATGAGWLGLTGDELRGYLLGEVCREVGAEIKLPAGDLDVRRPLLELGLDSVMTVIIRRRLEKQFRISLPATLLWDCPTASAVAEYLAQRLTVLDAPEPRVDLVEPVVG